MDAEQHAEFRNFLTYCHPEMFLFDLGAHYGLFSLAAARFNAKAVAVDPSPIAVRMIARQLDLNQARQSIRVVQAAVSDANGVLQMLSSGVFSEGYLQLVGGRSPRELTAVKAVTIDELTSEFGAPTHIKIDVEGHEAAVLRGGRTTMSRFAPQLFLELHNQMVIAEGRNPNDVLDELDSLRYETLSLSGSPVDRTAILRNSIIRIVARPRQEVSA
jgi:FkbM family methyltransferase